MNCQRNWLSELFDCSPSPLIVLNQDANIENLNLAACELCGKSRNELIGTHIEEVINDINSAKKSCTSTRQCSDFPWQLFFFKTLLEGEKQSSQEPIQFNSRDSETGAIRTRHFLVNTAQLFLENGPCVCFGLREVTEQMHLEDSLRKASQISENFLALINHELKTPLNPIRGYAELLLADVKPEQRMMVSTIIQAADKELRLIEELVNYTELLSGSYPLDISEFQLMGLLLTEFDSQSANQPADRLVEYAFFNEAPGSESIPHNQCVRGNKLLIHKAVFYLLSTISRMSSSGQINMSVSVNSSPKLKPPWYVVSIKIEASSVNHDKLQSCPILNTNDLNAARPTTLTKGFGLGLPITAELARILNGELTIESRDENGSVITLEIPLQFID